MQYFLFAFLINSLFSPLCLNHQLETQPSASIIKKLSIRGLRRFPESEVKSWIKSRKGTLLSQERLDSDMHSLYLSGHFQDIKIYVEDAVRGGKLITFEIFEKPTISSIRFEGVASDVEIKLLNDLLQEGYDFAVGSEYDPVLCKQVAKVMEGNLLKKGQLNPKISPWVEDRRPTQVAVIFRLETGTK